MIRLLDAPATNASTCGDVATRIFEFLDGELVPDESSAVRQHLAACSRCRGIVERDRRFLDVVHRRTRVERASPWLRRRLLATLADEASARRLS